MAEIRLFAAPFQPKNWAYCDGRLISISSNSALFSLLGTTYGGDGRVTFALPDFRGRAAVGVGTGQGLSNWTLGEMTGSESTTILTSQMPDHVHNAPVSIPLSDNPSGGTEINGNYLMSNAGSNIYGAAASNGIAMVAQTVPSMMAGNGAPVNLRQPYIGMNYIVCMYGIYPSRN